MKGAGIKEVLEHEPLTKSIGVQAQVDDEQYEIPGAYSKKNYVQTILFYTFPIQSINQSRLFLDFLPQVH